MARDSKDLPMGRIIHHRVGDEDMSFIANEPFDPMVRISEELAEEIVNGGKKMLPLFLKSSNPAVVKFAKLLLKFLKNSK